MGQVDQGFHGEAGIGVQVGGHDGDLKRAFAADVVAAHHLGQSNELFFQFARHLPGVAVGVQAHEGDNAEAYFVAVDRRVVTGYVALSF